MKGGLAVKEKLLAFFLGRRLEDTELSEEKFNVLWGIPIFASDAISSVSYAGEEILLVLMPVLAMASFRVFLPIVAAIICLLGILVFCYRPTTTAELMIGIGAKPHASERVASRQNPGKIQPGYSGGVTQNSRASYIMARNSPYVRRVCCIESRSRTVNVPSFVDCSSTVMHQGVPASSCLR